MSSKMRHGDGDDAEVLNETFSNTTAIVSDGDDQRDVDSIGAQLINDFIETSAVGSDDDSADNSSAQLIITELGDFTGLEGATITIEGSEDNDGEYEIVTVNGANDVEVDPAPPQDETFSDAVTFTLTRTDEPPAGSWKIEVSNDFVPQTNGTVYGQIPQSGTWTDITSEFSPSIDTVTTAGSQYA